MLESVLEVYKYIVPGYKVNFFDYDSMYSNL